MAIRLRAHHLLCLLTWRGEGYSPAFTANFHRIADLIGQDGTVRLVDGPDDICAPRVNDPGAHCLLPRLGERDRQAASDLALLLQQPVTAGAVIELTPATLSRLRAAFAAGQVRSACAACDWRGLCDGVAAGGFAGTRLQP